jgi:hypothetical protein
VKHWTDGYGSFSDRYSSPNARSLGMLRKRRLEASKSTAFFNDIIGYIHFTFVTATCTSSGLWSCSGLPSPGPGLACLWLKAKINRLCLHHVADGSGTRALRVTFQSMFSSATCRRRFAGETLSSSTFEIPMEVETFFARSSIPRI